MPARALKANEFDGVWADLLGTCGHTGVWCALVTSIRSDTTVGVDNVPLRQNCVPMFPSGPTPSLARKWEVKGWQNGKFWPVHRVMVEAL